MLRPVPRNAPALSVTYFLNRGKTLVSAWTDRCSKRPFGVSVLIPDHVVAQQGLSRFSRRAKVHRWEEAFGNYMVEVRLIPLKGANGKVV
jgi:hypothetical protein